MSNRRRIRGENQLMCLSFNSVVRTKIWCLTMWCEGYRKKGPDHPLCMKYKQYYFLWNRYINQVRYDYTICYLIIRQIQCLIRLLISKAIHRSNMQSIIFQKINIFQFEQDLPSTELSFPINTFFDEYDIQNV